LTLLAFPNRRLRASACSGSSWLGEGFRRTWPLLGLGGLLPRPPGLGGRVRARLGDLLRVSTGEAPLLVGRRGEGTLGEGTRLEGRMGEDTWRLETSPLLGDPAFLALVCLAGEAGRLEPRTLGEEGATEFVGDILFLRRYFVGMARPPVNSFCSRSGEERMGGVSLLGAGLTLWCGEVGGDMCLGLYCDTTGSLDGLCGWGVVGC